MRLRFSHNPGFTLIELSIVLVIIGLIVGGILVGQDLIRAAGERAQISQIEKFNTAVNTFRSKYGYLPGDIKDPDASTFGFMARGSLPGQGDGNGVIMGWNGSAVPHTANAGESPMVWVDLSAAHLIEGMFTAASPTTCPASAVSGVALNNWFPNAKAGYGNYVVVMSGDGVSLASGINYFGLVAPTSMASGWHRGVRILTPIRPD